MKKLSIFCLVALAAITGCSKENYLSCSNDYHIQALDISAFNPMLGEPIDMNIMIGNKLQSDFCAKQLELDTQSTKLLVKVYYQTTKDSCELAGTAMLDVPPVLMGEPEIIRQNISFLRAGFYSFFAECDATNLIKERDETNNSIGRRHKRTGLLGTIVVVNPARQSEEGYLPKLKSHQNQFVTFQNHNTQ